jgi:CRP-like cAMP-binding protein
MRIAQTRASASETPGTAAPLTAKLARSVSLSPQEMAVLAELQVPMRPVRRHREIITEGRKYAEIYVLLEGIAIRYRVSHDGRRQVLNIVLPGDFIGFPACFFENALFSIVALTDTQVSAVPLSRLLTLFERHRRLAAMLLWQFSCEAAMYAEHLIDLGRRSAVERVAHFLLELLIRLQAIGLAEARSYSLPLTQAVMGDLLGLSVAHVNRSLRQLRDDGLVSIDGRSVAIKDFEGLAAIADFEKSYISRFRINEVLTAN